MNTAREYAQALIAALEHIPEGHEDACVARFIAHIEHAGQTKLLPKIIRAIETEVSLRKEKNRATIFFARSQDAARYQVALGADIKALGGGTEEMTNVIDPYLVGGYMIKTRDRLLDRSTKRALVDLYQRICDSSITTQDSVV